MNHRVIHIADNLDDGAGKAALRLHRHMLESGLDSYLYNKHIHKIDQKIIRVHEQSSFKKVFIFFKRAWLRIVATLILKDKHLPFNLNGIICFKKTLPSIFNKNDKVIIHANSNFFPPDQLRIIQKITSEPLFIHPLDMEPVTGGCHFSFSCENYKSNCCSCPQLRAPWKDIIPKKILENKKLLANQNIELVCVNEYTKNIASHSFLFSSFNPHKVYLPVNSNRSNNIKKSEAREKLGLPKESFIFLFGCFKLDDYRKGGDIILKTFNQNFTDKNICLATFGHTGSFDLTNSPDTKWKHFGLVREDEKMNLLYRACDVFLSPSRDDLGPTTITEAFANELPTISFDIGSALDFIENEANGFIVKSFNEKKFAEIVKKALTHSFTPHSKEEELKRRITLDGQLESWKKILQL